MDDGWIDGRKDEGERDNGYSIDHMNQLWRGGWIPDGWDMLFKGNRMDKCMEMRLHYLLWFIHTHSILITVL